MTHPSQEYHHNLQNKGMPVILWTRLEGTLIVPSILQKRTALEVNCKCDFLAHIFRKHTRFCKVELSKSFDVRNIINHKQIMTIISPEDLGRWYWILKNVEEILSFLWHKTRRRVWASCPCLLRALVTSRCWDIWSLSFISISITVSAWKPVGGMASKQVCHCRRSME